MRRIISALMLCTSLAACGETPLAPTEARPATGAKSDARPRVAFCYNSAATTPKLVLDEARSACGVGSTPRLVADGLSLAACPVLSPARVTFVCERRSGD